MKKLFVQIKMQKMITYLGKVFILEKSFYPTPLHPLAQKNNVSPLIVVQTSRKNTTRATLVS